ncbi:MAG: CNNM domain-containing protein, partial [Planctomycetota bacterium]|nr:CNNM domain-containing protein [Planctomycetota bacterium]
MIALVGAVTLVLIVSALCSLLEAVLYSVPISHVESMADQGKRSGRLLQRLRKNMDQPISAILSLNTVAHTVGAAVAGAMVAKLYGEEYLGWFSAIFTLAILILTEILPKTAGITFNKRLSGPLSFIIQGLVWGMFPLVWLCQLTTRIFTSKSGHETDVSDHELMVMTKLGLQAGTIDKMEGEVIKNILTIERKDAAEIMTPSEKMTSLAAKMTVSEASQHPDFYKLSRFPVFDKDKDDIVGLAHRPQILRMLAEDQHDLTLNKVMTPVKWTSVHTPVSALLHLFLEKRNNLFIVL